MAKRDVELALKKQQLQMQSRQLRDDWDRNVQGIKPAFAGADAVQRGWAWLRAHPAVPVAVVVAVAFPLLSMIVVIILNGMFGTF